MTGIRVFMEDLMKPLRYTGVLLALMVMTMMCMPAVAAQSAKNAVQPRLIPPDAEIRQISNDGTTSVSTLIFRLSETDVRYYRMVQTKKIFADGTENGTILVQTQDPCGCDPRGSFGKESDYTKTPEGIWVHLGPQDLSEAYAGEDGHRKFAGMFALITGLTPGESALFGEYLLPDTRFGRYISTQKDGSLDFFMTDDAVKTIHLAVNFNKYCLWIGVNYTNYVTSFCV